MTTEQMLSALIADQPAVNAISFSGGLDFGNETPQESQQGGQQFADFDPNAYLPARHRRTDKERYFAFAKDAFDYVSGLDKNGFLGKTEQVMNNYDKERMNEDPEGYQIDMNRAKALAQRAYATKDPEMKKKYGAAIKQLLPQETQGMDDLTASEFLVGSEKMEIEKLKAANRLAVQAMKNRGSLDTAGVKADSAERIATMKAENAIELKMLDSEMKQALKDKDFEKAAMIQDKIMERTLAGKEMDFDRAEMQEQYRLQGKEYTADSNLAGKVYAADKNLEGRTYTADKGYEGKVYAADKGYEGKVYAADKSLEGRKYAADVGLEKAKVQQAAANMRALVSGGNKANSQNAKAQAATSMVNYLTSPEQVAMFDKLNNAAGQFSYGGEWWNTLTGSERGQAWMNLESYMTRGIVQLAKSLGSNPSNEDARRISNMFGLNSHLSPTKRREAWFDTLQYVAATSNAGLPVDGSVSPSQVAGYYAANANVPQATSDIENIEAGSVPSGQEITASGNYLF